MKKIFIPFFMLFLAAITGCGNATADADKTEKATADSLLRVVLDGHDVGMARMGKLSKAEMEVKRLMDSLAKLPAKTQQAAAPLKTKLNDLLGQLNYADSSMNKWMNEFKYDSLEKDIKGRIEYLSTEKLKVGKIKEDILGSLQNADSILRKKF